MKKIKLIVPLIGAAAAVGTIVPTLTACSQVEANKVALLEGQEMARTVTTDSGDLAYYFRQENPSSPEKTKAYFSDFKINGEKTTKTTTGDLTFNVDSVGNMRVTCSVQTLLETYTTANTISFKLLFENSYTGTKYEIGPFTITIDRSSSETSEGTSAAEAEATTGEESVKVETEVVDNSYNNDAQLIEIKMSQVPKFANKYMPKDLTLTCGNQQLVEGVDYIYFVVDDGKTGRVWIPSYLNDTVNIKFTPSNTNVTDSREDVPFDHSTASFSNNVFTVDNYDIGYDFTSDIPSSGIEFTKMSIDTNLVIVNNDDSFYTTAAAVSNDVVHHTSIDSALAAFKTACTTLNGDSVDQQQSCLLVKYDIEYQATAGEIKTYYGSFGIKVEKNTAVEIPDKLLIG